MSEAISNVYRDITLDLYNTDSSPVTVKAMQGDTASRFLNVLLTNAGEPYTPDDEAHAQLFVIKPDGYIVYNNGTIESDTITFELTNQILAVPGKCKCQVLLWDRDYEQVVRTATPLFVDIAEKLDDESAIASTNEYGVLEDILQEIEEGGHVSDNNFTDAYRAKLDMVNANAEPNQNAFSKFIVQGTSLTAGQESDSVQMSIGEGLMVATVEELNMFQLSLDLPDASELERGLLTPEDYIRFSTAQSGDHTIKEVTATAVTIELSDSTEVSLARTDGTNILSFDDIYPVGSLFRTEMQNGYPTRGSWTLSEKELKAMSRVYTYNGTTKLNVRGSSNKQCMIINFIAILPATLSGIYDGTPFELGSMPTSTMLVPSFTGLIKEYIHGSINNADAGVSVPALFSVTNGSTSTLTLEKWEGSLPETPSNKCHFSLTISFSALSPSTTDAPIVYIYRRIS